MRPLCLCSSGFWFLVLRPKLKSDLALELDRQALDDVRLVAPLLHRSLSRLCQDGIAAEMIRTLDLAIGRNYNQQENFARQILLARSFGINGRNPLHQQLFRNFRLHPRPAGKVKRPSGVSGGRKKSENKRNRQQARQTLHGVVLRE